MLSLPPLKANASELVSLEVRVDLEIYGNRVKLSRMISRDADSLERTLEERDAFMGYRFGEG
mgnify:CR=1 FL=1